MNIVFLFFVFFYFYPIIEKFSIKEFYNKSKFTLGFIRLFYFFYANSICSWLSPYQTSNYFIHISSPSYIQYYSNESLLSISITSSISQSSATQILHMISVLTLQFFPSFAKVVLLIPASSFRSIFFIFLSIKVFHKGLYEIITIPPSLLFPYYRIFFCFCQFYFCI